jgi:hypothetical protein
MKPFMVHPHAALGVPCRRELLICDGRDLLDDWQSTFESPQSFFRSDYLEVSSGATLFLAVRLSGQWSRAGQQPWPWGPGAGPRSRFVQRGMSLDQTGK